MAWIKRNLFFVLFGIVALGLLAAAGLYDFKSWKHNTTALENLNKNYNTLQQLNEQSPSAGNEKVDNIKAAREQRDELHGWVRQTGKYFEPISTIPVPNSTNGVTSERFAAALRRTIDQLEHDAANAGVIVPPKYSFSFEAERSLVRFDPAGLDPLATQLGEVKAICGILFAARVNSLDNLRRVRVSGDDATGPQTDYFEEPAVTNNLAVLTPYEITFRGFSQNLANVLAEFASSPSGFVVKSVNIEPAGTAAALSSDATAPAAAPAPSGVAPGRGGLQTVLNEQLLRGTLVVEVVKLLPGK